MVVKKRKQGRMNKVSFLLIIFLLIILLVSLLLVSCQGVLVGKGSDGGDGGQSGNNAPPPTPRGDLNSDNILTIDDVIILLRHIHRMSVLSNPEQIAQADTNCDGQVDVRDVTTLVGAIVLKCPAIEVTCP